MTDRMNWDGAACAEVGVEWFHPEGHIGGTTYTEAKMVCRVCPIKAECLEFAMRMESVQKNRYGVWGGLTPSQRRVLATRRRERGGTTTAAATSAPARPATGRAHATG